MAYITRSKRKISPLDKLRGLRAEHRITQSMLAKALGVSVPTYSRKEGGYNEFTQREIDIILKIFQASYADVFLPKERVFTLNID
ncbi:MAG: helix-turn-helix domain-containing protein [Clostridiales bacterium]|nr:helix-turn-helix domain-containing protein [Clostridiales bacterium]